MTFLKTLALCAAFVGQGTPVPASDVVLKPIRDLRAATTAKTQKKELVDAEAVKAEIKALAARGVAGIDPTKVPAEDADGWSELFRLAGRDAEATALAESSVRYHGMKAWSRQCELLPEYLARDDKAKILRTLDTAVSLQINMAGQMGEFVIYGLAPKYAASDPKVVLDAFDILLRRVNPDRPLDENERYWMKFAYARLSAHRDAVLYETGKKETALAHLAKVRTEVAGDERAIAAVDEVYKQLAITEKTAPTFEVARTLGTYAGLPALRGKVVLLDFFAHWCGPCKRAFPDMKALYAQNKAKGLEIVGVTDLYGYYGSEQGLKPEAEFARMRDKFVPEFGLPWPIAFEKDKTASQAYGVSTIPQLVVIDRQGNVRKIAVGYTPAEFAKTKALVEELLAEKAST